jgi:hypothetical protein
MEEDVGRMEKICELSSGLSRWSGGGGGGVVAPRMFGGFHTATQVTPHSSPYNLVSNDDIIRLFCHPYPCPLP